ncbi:DUF6262 family protein [Streptomyces sp. NPDC014995]|uniref:DUF6262 family protein n=1 Tax=Streptomyces sp. NPDC014995 TaxID=3364936 RepID=UPI0036FDCF66
MNTAAIPEPRTAAALAARRRSAETALQRVSEAITRLRREKAQVSVAAVARRADVSRTFLYDNPEARAAVASAMAEAGERRTQMLTLDERLKAARSNLRFQDRRVADLEARIADPGPAPSTAELESAASGEKRGP